MKSKLNAYMNLLDKYEVLTQIRIIVCEKKSVLLVLGTGYTFNLKVSVQHRFTVITSTIIVGSNNMLTHLKSSLHKMRYHMINTLQLDN